MNFFSFWKGFIVLLLVILLGGGVIFTNRILGGDAFNREEAGHALNALWIQRDMQAEDWDAFWYDTQRQMVWPFLHSWVLAVLFLIFGVGYNSARILSFVFFLSSLLLIYIITNRMSEKDGPRIGVLAVILALTSPLILRYAALNTLESMGALLFLSASYVYMVCEERKLTLFYVLLAFLIGLSIYTNYLYAYLMLPAFLVVTLAKLGPLLIDAVRLSRKGEKAAIPFIWWAYKKLIALLVLLALAAAWFSFSFSRKILLLLGSIFKFSGGVEAKGVWQSLAYYPGVIVQDISFSPWLGIFLLISLLLPFAAHRYRWLNKLFVYVWTGLLLLTLTIPAKAPQMIYILVPFILIIFSAGIFTLLDLMRAKNARLAKVLLLVIFLPAVFSLPRAYGVLFPFHPAENMLRVMEYFNAGVPEDASLAIPFNLQHLNPDGVKFYFRDRRGAVLSDPQLSEEELFSQGEYFLAIELDEGSFYRPEVSDDSLYRWNAWLRHKAMTGGVQPYSSRHFESIGLTAKIYRKTPGL